MPSDNELRTAIACSRCAKAKQVPCTRCKQKRVHCESRATRRYASQSNGSFSSSKDFVNHTFVNKPFSVRQQRSEELLTWDNPPDATSPHRHSPIDPWITNSLDQNTVNGNDALPVSADDTIESFVIRDPLKQSPRREDVTNGAEYILPMEGLDYTQDHSDYFLPQSPSRSVAPSALNVTQTANGIIDVDSLDFHSTTLDTGLPTVRPAPPPKPGLTVKHVVPESTAIISAQEHWSCFTCNPASKEPCPETASAHIDGLIEALKTQDVWDSLDIQQAESDLSMSRAVSTGPVVRNVRDKLLEYTKQLLRNAMEARLPRSPTRTPDEAELESIYNSTEQIVLPPPHVLRYFLRAFVCVSEPFYSTIPAGVLSPESILNEGTVHSQLLVLLMLAQGAMTNPSVEARLLSSGLTEICRIALNQVMEREVFIIRVDTGFLCNALHYLNLASWGGDKSHMDVAIGQRGIYMSMLQMSGILEPREDVVAKSGGAWDVEKLWRAWKEEEIRRRLVYSWVNVDQEVSMFYDTTPLLSVGNLRLAMPSADVLWQSTSAADWWSLYESGDHITQPPTLNDLFKQFMDDGLLNSARDIPASHLRLLLHPLQGLCSHLGQYLTIFSTNYAATPSSRLIATCTSRTRLDDVRSLLRQWWMLYTRSAVVSSPDPAVSTALVMYHLISLGTLLCVSEVEALLRQDPVSEPFRQHFNLRIRLVESAEEIYFHCGQVLRLLCLLKRSARPIWWPAALYRVALMSFMTSAARAGSLFGPASPGPSKGDNVLSINTAPPEDPAIGRFLKLREGIPTITKRDGAVASVDMPETVIEYCIDVLDEDLTTRMAEGIRNRLVRLMQRWMFSDHQDQDDIDTNDYYGLTF
ncbi:MAG: hypothetical protein M1820_002826 [Bogoriella megaspora]|nr:MAG: hypothetical protein M1820_002826 [Bogoriella megaspora]